MLLLIRLLHEKDHAVAVVEGPAQKPLKEFETILERGRVLIAIPGDTV